METNEKIREYTKPELAELFGVTTQAIDKKLNKLDLREKCRKDESKRLWIPADVAQLLADEYGTRLETGLNQDETPETDEIDWKELYFAEKKRNDELADELISLSRSNQELSDKVVALLGAEKALEQAERFKELAAPAGDAERVEPAVEPEKPRKKGFFARLFGN